MKMLRPKAVCEILGGCSIDHLNSLRSQPDFPKPVHPYPGAHSLMFFEDEIFAYLEKLRKARDGSNDINQDK
jgi:predicted DNA-binding transcriptional regulator AlpA